ncbi:hypothetical protein A0H81_01885 [Grifola frondosa]|uniref:Uncharacterized protein n=1 Tax=Grifola frondosa TaxID=5627 RepID=A0A1C7MMM9_GRIFR|nr:hypothetical protein A0H81_01885 [Grifola frondosa]
MAWRTSESGTITKRVAILALRYDVLCCRTSPGLRARVLRLSKLYIPGCRCHKDGASHSLSVFPVAERQFLWIRHS